MPKAKRTKNPIIKLKPLIDVGQPFELFDIPEKWIWTGSSLKQFRKCKRKFFWKYIMRITPRYLSCALLIGTAFHEALAIWYSSPKRSMKPIANKFVREAKEKLRTAYLDQDEHDKFSALSDTLGGMLLGYSEIYAHEKKDWGIKKKFIETPFSVDMGDFFFDGKIDLFTRMKKWHMVVEHKTAATIQDSYIDRLPLDTQVRGYCFGMTKGLGQKVDKVVYDVVKKCKLRKKSGESLKEFTNRIMLDYMSRPDFYFFRETLTFDKKSLAAFEHELHQTHNEFKFTIFQAKDDPMDPRAWCPNDTMCNEFFKTCPYQELCLNGLDAGSALMYEQNKDLHVELSETK